MADSSSEEGRSGKLFMNFNICVCIYVVNHPFILFCCLKSPQDEERFRGTLPGKELQCEILGDLSVSFF